MDSGPEGNFQHGSGSSHLGHGSSFMPLFINNTHVGLGSSWANTRLNPPEFRQLNSPPKPMSVGHDSAPGVFLRLAGGHSIDRERGRKGERERRRLGNWCRSRVRSHARRRPATSKLASPRTISFHRGLFYLIYFCTVVWMILIHTQLILLNLY